MDTTYTLIVFLRKRCQCVSRLYDIIIIFVLKIIANPPNPNRVVTDSTPNLRSW